MCMHVSVCACVCAYVRVHICVFLPFYQGMVGMRCHPTEPWQPCEDRVIASDRMLGKRGEGQ